LPPLRLSRKLRGQSRLLLSETDICSAIKTRRRPRGEGAAVCGPFVFLPLSPEGFKQLRNAKGNCIHVFERCFFDWAGSERRPKGQARTLRTTTDSRIDAQNTRMAEKEAWVWKAKGTLSPGVTSGQRRTGLRTHCTTHAHRSKEPQKQVRTGRPYACVSAFRIQRVSPTAVTPYFFPGCSEEGARKREKARRVQN